MSVVTDSSRNRVIFCEGNANSPDIIFWKRILVDEKHEQAKYRCEIKPMGGKQVAKNFALGYELATNNQNWFILRDRDLDAPQLTPESTLVRWGKIILTGSTCIESYFVSAELIHNFLEINKLADKQKITDHHQALQDTLVELRDYQAVRWALQAIRTKVSDKIQSHHDYATTGQFDFPNRLTKEDGKLPTNLTLEACHEKASELCETFKSLSLAIDSKDLEQHIQDYVQQFQGDTFWLGEFRRWFHGKDVLAYWLRQYKNVNYKDYCIWASYNLDWKKHFPDLVEIQRICQSE
jgi:hypothetical protein